MSGDPLFKIHVGGQIVSFSSVASFLHRDSSEEARETHVASTAGASRLAFAGADDLLRRGGGVGLDAGGSAALLRLPLAEVAVGGDALVPYPRATTRLHARGGLHLLIVCDGHGGAPYR